MTDKEFVPGSAEAKAYVESLFAEAEKMADKLKVDVDVGDATYCYSDKDRPTVGDYWDMDYSDWEEEHPEWDGTYSGWQTSSTFC